MRDIRVDVGLKIIFLRNQGVPEGCGFGIGEFDPDDGLDTLEPVFPRRHQTDRRAVLGGQGAPVYSSGEEGQFVNRFFYRQGFGVGPGQVAETLLSWCDVGIIETGELDKTGV